MDLKPGDVVILKSGGQAMTVEAVNGVTVACVWMGEEGDLFRETLPRAVLDSAERLDDEDPEDAEDDDEEEDDKDDSDEPEHSKVA
jgi:uncharacterized protein YodC (DUF2158 family)